LDIPAVVGAAKHDGSLGVKYRYIWNELDGIEGTSSGFMSRILLILQ
jgi:hypothetical protein